MAAGMVQASLDTYDVTMFRDDSATVIGLGSFDYDNPNPVTAPNPPVTGLQDADGVGMASLIQVSFTTPPARGAPTMYQEETSTDMQVHLFPVQFTDTKGTDADPSMPILDNEIDGVYVQGLGAGTIGTTPTPASDISRVAATDSGGNKFYIYFYLFNPQTGVDPDDAPDVVFRKVWCLYTEAGLGQTPNHPTDLCPDGAVAGQGFYAIRNQSTPTNASAPGTLALSLAGLAAAIGVRRRRSRQRSSAAG
jgi:MYXO-CTERM domain-containing protein